MFKRQAKVNIVRINYRGTGPAALALVAGEVQVMFVGAGTAMPHMRSGKIRALAVTTPEPSPLAPGLPSVSASGLPGYEYSSFIGFQAPDTLGRRLVNRQPEVRILDRLYPVRAEVVVLNGFSSHADQDDFLTFLGPLATTTKKVRLVHGEPDRAEALAAGLRGAGFADVSAPARGESVELE